MSMLRHNSGSFISALQSYGDSDEEENDSKNESLNESTTEQTFENKDQKSKTPSPAPDIADEGISFTASQEGGEKSSEPSDKLTSQEETETSSGLVAQNEQKINSEVSPAELISDEEGDHSHAHERSSKDSSLKEAVRAAVGDAGNVDSPSSQGSVKPGRQAARLVSYGPDDDHDEDETSSEEENNDESASESPEAAADNSALSRSVRNMSTEEIQIPPEPPGKCPAALQKKIEDSYERMKRGGLDLNRSIQSKKHFRNPSIYEKLIDFCHIDEKSTNFPPEIYDPHIWGKESFYDELDKAQRKDMERREKEKKDRTKIEFLTGTKKTGGDPSSSGPSDEKRRKTKWDAQPSTNIQVSKLTSAGQNPGVVNLTTTATGTKATVIHAVGPLSKKSSGGK